VETQDFSSTWAAALPKLVTRRGALIDNVESTSSNNHRRRNSYDSEISVSYRTVAVESRRHSLDSQFSVQFSEVTATRRTTSSRPHNERRSRMRRPRRGDFGRGSRNRRGSSTSQDSQMGVQVMDISTGLREGFIDLRTSPSLGVRSRFL